MDVSFDLPDCFLPEFPPPLYLTTHPELGDVTRGVEITYGNYFEMFDGLITPELLKESQNQTFEPEIDAEDLALLAEVTETVTETAEEPREQASAPPPEAAGEE